MTAPPDVGAARKSAKRRRVLGDAWQDWDPAGDGCPAETTAGPSLFILVESLLALLCVGAWLLLLWIAEPRLASLGISRRAVLVAGLAGALLLLLPVLILGSLLWRLPWATGVTRALEQWVVLTLSGAELLGLRLGISRDRLGNSFVKVANLLSRCSRRAQPGHRLLLLAPRCLRPDLMRKLRDLGAAAGARVVVATGGEEARAAVHEASPAAVLAVACERDLVAGMRDVLPRATVFGVANRRPEGPCRNSEIDIEEAHRHLEILKGMTDPA